MKTPQDNNEEAANGNIQKRLNNLYSKQELPTHVSISEVEAMKARISELEAALLAQQQASDERAHLYQTPTLDSQQQKLSSVAQITRTVQSESEKDSGLAKGKETILKKIQRFFSAPVFVDDFEKTQSAKLLYQIIRVIWILPILLVTIGILGGRAEVIVPAIFLSITLLALMTLSRIGWVRFASISLTAMIVLLIGYADFQNAGNIEPSTLMFAVAIIMSGLLIGRRAPLVAAILIALSHAVIVYFQTQGLIKLQSAPAIGFENIVITTIMIFIIGSLFQFVISRLQFALDQSRKDEKELQISNRELQDLGTSLELRVADRTHDLELAAEVGRSITERVTDISDLLARSTELIRSKFNLYYTQIYIVDPSGNNLVLRAGTGSAGEELARRGHRLALTSDSLNGRAATTRKPVLVDDTRKSVGFLPNLLLPLTRSELAVPLIVNDKVVGVLDMQSETPETFGEANLPAFQVLAGQLAIAIQNSVLFNEVGEARSVLEDQARRLTSSGWRQFLNAVDHSESIGYIFNQDEVLPLVETQSPVSENTLTVPIEITGANVGEVQLTDETNRKWTDAETEIVRATVSRVGQHIENLRLLAQAERYRTEAEQVSRRLTREGWETYLQTRSNLASGYTYNLNEIKPLDEAVESNASLAQTRPITVRDETIGELLINTENVDLENVNEIFSAVAAQLGDHIENLRLLEETEEQRGDADKLYKIGQKISAAKDRQEIIAAVAGNLGLPQINRAIYLSYEYGASGEMENVTITANWYSGNGVPPTPLGQRYSTKVFTIASHFNSTDPGFVGNTLTDERVDPATRKVFQAQKICAFVSLPVWVDGRQAGSLLLQSEEVISFTGKELLPYTSIMQQVTNALVNQNLIEQTVQGEARFRSLVENAPEAIVVVDLTTGLFTDPNDNAVKLYGLSREELLKVGPAQMSPPMQPDGRDSTEKAMEKISEAMQDIPTVFDWVHRNAQGQDIPCEIRLVRLPGNLQQVRASVTDITERKKSQDIIARRALELQSVATVSATASTVLNPDKLLQAVVDLTKERFDMYHVHVYLADEAWNTLLLAAGAGEIGRQMVETGHAIQMDAERSLVARAARERNSIIVNDVRNAAGFLPNPMLPETRSEMAVPMIAGDKVIGVFDVQSNTVGHFTDEDANIYTTLASQVAVALQNARLYVEQAATVTQLRELDRLKSSFLANMSHELRTPLNSILGFADVMLEGLDGPLTDNMNNDLGLIQKNGQHLLHLINDVLDMAKIDSGKMNLNVEKFNVHELFMDVISITSSLAKERSLALVIENDSDREVEINADKIRLRQVMINLVNNAMKFTEKGQVALRVVHEENNVLIRVQDTGIGIPADHLEAVFQEFTQVDTTTTRKAGGTGLGLPISRRLINMHSGRLWAESSGVSGAGSAFYVYLPIEANINENATLTAN